MLIHVISLPFFDVIIFPTLNIGMDSRNTNTLYIGGIENELINYFDID